jgi:hypothetical protein
MAGERDQSYVVALPHPFSLPSEASVKKLALTIENLQVESFTTNASVRRSGTVFGLETEAGTCWAGDSCWGCESDGCTDPSTRGVHCGPQETMNDLDTNCNAASLAGPTCEGVYGYTCGQLCTADC